MKKIVFTFAMAMLLSRGAALACNDQITLFYRHYAPTGGRKAWCNPGDQAIAGGFLCQEQPGGGEAGESRATTRTDGVQGWVVTCRPQPTAGQPLSVEVECVHQACVGETFSGQNPAGDPD